MTVWLDNPGFLQLTEEITCRVNLRVNLRVNRRPTGLRSLAHRWALWWAIASGWGSVLHHHCIHPERRLLWVSGGGAGGWGRWGGVWRRETGCVVTAEPRRHRWPPVDFTVRWKHKHNTARRRHPPSPPPTLMLSTGVAAITVCPNKNTFWARLPGNKEDIISVTSKPILPAPEPAGIFFFLSNLMGILIFFFQKRKSRPRLQPVLYHHTRLKVPPC